jgi:transcription antitermination factor NusG
MRHFLPGEQVKVIDGTFAGELGRVVSRQDALAMWEKVGGEKPLPTGTVGIVDVVLPISGRQVPVVLEPFQIEPASGPRCGN